MEDMSVALGVPVDELNAPENARAAFQYSAARFTSEKIENRLSDFCWWIRTAWGWLGLLSQLGILLVVTWYSFTDSLANAVNAWIVLGVAILFWGVAALFSLACKLLTGRYPGQARQARKALAAFVKDHPATLTKSALESSQ